MKFSKTLASHLTPEWRNQYLDYDGLKLKLEAAQKKVEFEENPESYFDQADEGFFENCAQQLQKIDLFFNLKIAEAQQKFSELQTKFDTLINLGQNVRMPNKKQLRFVFTEYYYSLVLLANFQSLNYTGFRKILKKHDKLFKRSNGAEWFDLHVEKSSFKAQTEELSTLIKTTENTYIELENGDRSYAMKKLRVPPLDDLRNPLTMLFLGIGIGLLITLVSVLFFCLLHSPLDNRELVTSRHLHRPILLLLLYMLLLSVNVLGWRKFGVNHILIFELEPRNHLSGYQLMCISVYIGVLWALSFIGCLLSDLIPIPRYTCPLILSLLLLAYLSNPLNILHKSSRYWLLRTASHVVMAPFVEVRFADFWLGDQLVSLTTFIADLFRFVCFFLKNRDLKSAHIDPVQCLPFAHIFSPIITALPVWFRFVQCLRRYRDNRRVHPFLTNAAKYASIFPCIGLSFAFHHSKNDYSNIFRNPVFWSYMSSRLVCTAYGYYWDIVEDFGLLKISHKGHFLLRDQIIYPAFTYYLVMVLDLILRFSWLFQVALTENNIVPAYDADTIFSCLEVFRRYMWNYYRLENEHLYNCGLFRAVRDISIKIMLPAGKTSFASGQSAD